MCDAIFMIGGGWADYKAIKKNKKTPIIQMAPAFKDRSILSVSVETGGGVYVMCTDPRYLVNLKASHKSYSSLRNCRNSGSSLQSEVVRKMKINVSSINRKKQKFNRKIKLWQTVSR